MKLLIVDPNLSLSSPSMKGVIRSLPTLKAQGWEIEAWCWDCDEGLPVDCLLKLPRFGRVHTLYGYAFSLWARLRAWWKFSVKHEARPDVIYSVAWYLPDCDVAHVHFSHWDWERRQQMLGMKSLRDVYERVTNLAGRTWANRFLRRTTAKTVISVSEAVADDLRAVNPKLNVRVLPNCYDPRRFHAGIRAEARPAMRQKLGFAVDDVVFVFVSAGHYRRKGLFLAADAIASLRSWSGRPVLSDNGVHHRYAHARMLVVGGGPDRLAGLQKELEARHPAWRQFITFTGMVPDVERYFAAADAFLFPSYSEAFALVEVEAAACGLPLFLTRHHGSEMILEDGVNGKFVEFDPHQIAAVLAEFVRGGWRPAKDIHLKRALDMASYATAFEAELSSACSPAASPDRQTAPAAIPLPMRP